MPARRIPTPIHAVMRPVVGIQAALMAVITGYPPVLSPIAMGNGVPSGADIMPARRIPTPIQLAMRRVTCIDGVRVATTPMDDAPPPGTGISALDTAMHAGRIPTPIRGCGRVGIRIAVVGIMRG